MPTADLPFKEGSLRIDLPRIFSNCRNESDVEDAYIEIFKKAFRSNGNRLKIYHPYKTDGVMLHKTFDIHVLMEFKFNKELTTLTDQAKVLVQVLYYLKQFEEAGEDPPSVVFIGDLNECFLLHVNALLPYLDSDVDWSVAPSQVAAVNVKLVQRLMGDKSIRPWIYDIQETPVEHLLNEMCSLSRGEPINIRVTEKNVCRLFSHFRDNVISHSDKYSPNDLVAMFMGLILSPQDAYLHPKKQHVLVTDKFGEVRVSTNQYEAFVGHYDRELSTREKEVLTSSCDRLIEDTARRFRGEFYTDTVWADEAHRMITEALGEDWKDEYVVWDPAWGTGNLTRDYAFKELYCSTLYQSDLDIGAKYNPGATKFQYDFLSEMELGDRVPEGLKRAFVEKRKILFFLNPPFGARGSMKFDTDVYQKTGVSNTLVREAMSVSTLLSASQQLYAQFLYRITALLESYGYPKWALSYLACFSKPLFLSSTSFQSFRDLFLSLWGRTSRMLFQASEFAGVSGQWGVSFSIWRSK